MRVPVPVIDVFAGPGGLAEGFASLQARDGRDAFDIVLSIEKEQHAHRTLTLRKVFRRIGEAGVGEVFRRMASGLPPGVAFDLFPSAYSDARARAIRLELGPRTEEAVSAARARLRGRDPWVLLGGPPCQAYSLVGRARRRGIADYVPEEDERHTLYLEYLQLLADCEPAAFVMENVKGMLSTMLAAQYLFDRIAGDLVNPAKALCREGRRARGQPRYELYAYDGAGLRISSDPRDFVVRAERCGVPQARHRVIIIGIRDGIKLPSIAAPQLARPLVTVARALEGLPRLRSGMSQAPDSPAKWREFLRGLATRSWRSSLPPDVAAEIDGAAKRATAPRQDRGAEAMHSDEDSYVFNHSTRAHMPSDLERYFFAASYARVVGRSPTLHDFPAALLPDHRNVCRALVSGTFSDRFRVQLGHAAATTITSHIAKDGHYYIHFDARQCRSLTVREAARLQTFPDDYIFTGPRTAQYLQVGNAVPPLLAQQIATVVHTLVS